MGKTLFFKPEAFSAANFLSGSSNDVYNGMALLKSAGIGFASAIIVLICAISANPVSAQTTVSPGAVQPQFDRPTTDKKQDKDVLSVPAVPERPLGMEEGPAIEVRRFQLNFRLDQADDNQQKEKLATEARDILENIRQSRQNFTIGQLQQAANSITEHYRRAGYILATAYIPQQQVNNGVVMVEVLIGKVGKVSVDGNQLYSDETLLNTIAHVSGKELEVRAMESALLRVDDLPGLEAFGIFRPGENIGEADLIIKAQQEDEFEFLVIGDNYGTDTTGSKRLLGIMNWNNPTDSGDRLSVTALQTFDPTDSLYGAIQYELPITNAHSIGISYNKNTYDVGREFNNLELDGDTQIASLFIKLSSLRSRNLNVFSTLRLNHKKAELDSVVGELGEDRLATTDFVMGFDSIDQWWGGGINEGSLALSYGIKDFLNSMDEDGDNRSLRTGGSGKRAGGGFNKVTLEFSRLQSIVRNNTLLFKLEGQYSNDLLSSLEQFSIGGPNSVRAYPISEEITDKGVFTSLEWIINAPGFSDVEAFAGRTWGEVLKVSIYADYAKGTYNDPTNAQEEDVELSGKGIGIELSLSKTFYIRADVASPISDEDASDGDDPQFWFSAGYQF